MKSLSDVIEEYSPDFSEANDLVLQIYTKNFSHFFDIVDKFYYSMQKEKNKLSDEELEEILIDLPLNLFEVSDKVTGLRIQLEVTKLKNREVRENIRTAIDSSDAFSDMSKTDRKEAVARATASSMVPYELLADVYEVLLDLISNKVSFAKELIMSAKKVWTSRRETEDSMPVAEPDTSDDGPDLSAYDFNKKKPQQYVHG